MSRFLRFCLPALLVPGFTSCLKEKSVDSLDGGGGILRMKIDGKAWSANKAVVATFMNGFVSIVGESQDKIILNMQVETEDVGTFQFDQVSPHVAFVLDNNETVPAAYATDQGTNTSEAGGTIVITSLDMASKRMSGTFTFKALRASDNKTLMITEGIFENIPFQTQTPPTGNPGTGTMKATIGTTDWTAASVNSAAVSTMLTIIGGDPSRTITFMIPSDIQANTYNFSPAGSYTGFYTQGQTAYVAESGQLKIDEHNTTAKTIKGTFNFTAKDQGSANTIQITNGSFSASY